MVLYWSQFYHHFSHIEKNTERFRSNSFNYKQDPHGKYSWPSQFSQFFTSKYLPPYWPGICSCFIFSLLSCPSRLLAFSSSQISFAILPSQPFPFLLYPFNLTGLGKFSIFFHMPTFPIISLFPTFSFKSWKTFHYIEWPESITLLYKSASCSNS